MSWFKQFTHSSIGSKSVVALTGLAMVGFVVAHLSGNLLVFAGKDAINAYSEWLHSKGALLWVARLGLLAMVGLHIFFTIKLNINNKRARPIAYAKKSYTKAKSTSRTMVLSGLVLVSYIVYHLAHLTFRVTNPEIAQLDVYTMLVSSFKSPMVSFSYVVGMVLLGAHLSHGVSSLFQTLGLNHPKYNPIIRAIGPILGVALAVGFSSIPVSVLLGLVQ
jgi:succinate dehydrogenase / fumarate reductase cytochrome b subunit